MPERWRSRRDECARRDHDHHERCDQRELHCRRRANFIAISTTQTISAKDFRALQIEPDAFHGD
jgi:hypothetical protein